MENKSRARVNLITQRLNVFDPIKLTVIDDSAAHAGHAGAKESGGGHFNIIVVSTQFDGKSAVERHRMIYMALGDAMGTDIHALSINAQTPAEAANLAS